MALQIQDKPPKQTWFRWSHEREDEPTFLKTKGTSSPTKKDAPDVGRIKWLASLKKGENSLWSSIKMQSAKADTIGLGRTISPLLGTLPMLAASRWSVKHHETTPYPIRRPMEPSRDMSQEPGLSLQDRIHMATKDSLVYAADPMGDFSWSVPDPVAFSKLPHLLAMSRDWDAFKLVMCDLGFLWRFLFADGAVALAHVYEECTVAIGADGERCGRFVDYYNFVLQHLRHLKANPKTIFALAYTSKHNALVQDDATALVARSTGFILHWHERLSRNQAQDAFSPAKGLSSSFHSQAGKGLPTPHKHGKGAPAVQKQAFGTRDFLETLEHVRVKARLSHIQACGLEACFDKETKAILAQVIDQLVSKIQSSRSIMSQMGAKRFEEQNRLVLGLDDHATHSLEQPQRFLDLVGLWDESDKEEFANLTIIVQPKAMSDEKLRDDFERALCTQVAEAAHAPLELVDLVWLSFPAPTASNRKAMVTGKALLKTMEHVSGLQVTLVNGRDWPQLDSVSKPERVITLNLRRGRNKQGTENAHPPARQAVQAQKKTYTSKTATGSQVNPKFGDTFKMLIYTENQELVLVGYDGDKGARIAIGEVVLTVDDILSECHGYGDESFERSFTLYKPGTRKPVTHQARGQDASKSRAATILLRFRFYTHASNMGVTTQHMAERVMMQSLDDISALKLGCIVTGPAFEDIEGSWDTVQVYVASGYGEMAPMRKFLAR
mmetsp:Transcript_60934/g.139394  ORF Transcript_60934/g.139394 Transcript_60934/m.139394 type:complete len:723 (-) Transcript_60934:181-2349(-)